MKALEFAAVVVVGMGLVAGTTVQAQSTSDSKRVISVTPGVDPKKEADIRHLLEITGAKELVRQSMEAMEVNIKPLMTHSLPTGAYRDPLIELFFEKFHQKRDFEKLLDLAIPVYDKHFSDEELKGLIAFYETPLGKKSLASMPQVMAELREEGQKWGNSLGRECMSEVLAEHPDLAKALEQAAKQTKAQ